MISPRCLFPALLLLVTISSRAADARSPSGSYYGSDTGIVPVSKLWADFENTLAIPRGTIAIRARHRSEEGPLLERDLAPEETVFFEAVVRSEARLSRAVPPPGDSDQRVTLTWELLDNGDSPVSGIFKKIYANGLAATHQCNFLVSLSGMESGVYKARLTYRQSSDSMVIARSDYVFRIRARSTDSVNSGFGSRIPRSYTVTWARTNDRGTTFLSDGVLNFQGDRMDGQVKYSYMNVLGHLQVMTIHLSGRLDPETRLVAGTVEGVAIMNPVWGPTREGRVEGSFKGSEVGGGYRGTWSASSDVEFLFQSEHRGSWETR